MVGRLALGPEDFGLEAIRSAGQSCSIADDEAIGSADAESNGDVASVCLRFKLSRVRFRSFP